ncbi:MAG: chemotaxis protein CheA [bacterium]
MSGSGSGKTPMARTIERAEVEEFQDLLQGFSTALALADATDPASFQETVILLDKLADHPLPAASAAVASLLGGLREKVEELVLGGMESPQKLGAIEEDLRNIHRACEGEHDPCAQPQAESGDAAETGNPRAQRPPAAAVHDAQAGEAPLLAIESDRDLYEDFLLEAAESLESIEVKILSLEQDPMNRSVINEIFRPFHTIKGVSGFLNLDDINRLTHAVEDLLDKARQGEVLMGHREIDLVLEAVDLLRRLLECVKVRLAGGQAECMAASVDAFVARIAGLKQTGGAAAAQETAAPEALRGVAAGCRSGQDPAPLPEAAAPTAAAAAAANASAAAAKAAPAVREDESAAQKRTGSATIKVDMYKLDNLVNMVGELVIAQTLVQRSERVRSIVDHALTKNLGQLARITSELQNVSMSLRMVPLQQTFQKMFRVVRDLARKSSKAIELEIAGEDTEIDRNMVDAIYEPLVHMIRNSVDHGIEAPEERRRAGKPASGRIRLRALHKGGNVQIEIEDDGRGLNRQRILEKARERGLVGPDEAPSDHQIDHLIFRSGFSTAAAVTDISGRGVGMDVVRRAVDSLQGKVEIQSRPGRGCTFLIKLPITLAIIDGMLVGVGCERYVLPTVNIKEAIRPARQDCFTVEGRGEVIRIRGDLLPLVRLHDVLRIHPDRVHPWEALVVVVESDGVDRCLLVDEVFEMQDVVIKNLGNGWTPPEGVAGGSILGDGRVGLILDVNAIIRLHEGGCGRAERRAA